MALSCCGGLAAVGLLADEQRSAGLSPRSVVSSAASSSSRPAVVASSAVPGSPSGVPASSVSGAVPADVPGYLAALRGIDPGLTVNEGRAVSRGENTCLDIRQGKPEATVVDNARQRFDGGNAPVDEAKARRIVGAVRTYLCR